MSAPQVTPAMVEAQIASEHYFTGQDGANGAHLRDTHGKGDISLCTLDPLSGVQFCVLVLKNGHLVTGEALLQDLSKPDPERARASARRRAFDKAYDMVVYAERERLAHTQVLSLSISPTPERLAELREAIRNAPATPMPIVLEPEPATAWTVIDPANPDTLPAQGRWLVTVDTDDGREVHTLVHDGGGKWLHEGEYTFQHGYMFHPIAWASRPDGYDGEVQP